MIAEWVSPLVAWLGLTPVVLLLAIFLVLLFRRA